MKTSVAIIGSGPAGLLLGALLTEAGIDNVIVERVDKQRILGRVRAGVLERGTVGLLEQAGVATRLHSEALHHSGILIARGENIKRLDLEQLTGGKGVTVYGQVEITRDLMEKRESSGAQTIYNASDVKLWNINDDRPHVTYEKGGNKFRIDCDFVAGCDGHHGVSRQSLPPNVLRQYEHIYPFCWLGLLAEVPPCSDEQVYSKHSRGFALCSIRSKTRTRYYLQLPAGTLVEEWTDERFWDELKLRLPERFSDSLITGPSFDKTVTPLRSFVAESMQSGKLFLAGDAAHLVPPTGAKGLNLAASDVHYLFTAFHNFYSKGSDAGLSSYSDLALGRVWKTVRFAWWMTTMLHQFPEASKFDQRIRETELDYVLSSKAASTALAENYVGLPY